MLYEVRKGKKKVGTMRDMYTDDVSLFVLDVDKHVKVSERHHRFKEFGVMSKYLDWLFGAEKWSFKEVI